MEGWLEMHAFRIYFSGIIFWLVKLKPLQWILPPQDTKCNSLRRVPQISSICIHIFCTLCRKRSILMHQHLPSQIASDYMSPFSEYH